MHSHGGERRALAIALALVAGFAAVEAVVGLAAGSLALLADAAHMLSDSLALGLALLAAWLAQRPATPERSFGWRRGEVPRPAPTAMRSAASSRCCCASAPGDPHDAAGRARTGSDQARPLVKPRRESRGQSRGQSPNGCVPRVRRECDARG